MLPKQEIEINISQSAKITYQLEIWEQNDWFTAEEGPNFVEKELKHLPDQWEGIMVVF